jgi:hypothetical protein
MSVEGSAAQRGQPETQPRNGQQPLERRERFWDLKASHWVEVFLTVVLIVVGYLQYLVYSRQAGIMEQQTAISEAEHRPWISAYPVALAQDSVFHDDSGFNMTLIFPLKNTGHSPAKRVFPGTVATIGPFGDFTRKEACARAENGTNALAIFPNETVGQSIRSIIPEAEFTSLREQAVANNGGKIPGVAPAVIACIVYHDMETQITHHTPYVYSLAGQDPSSSPLQIIMKRGDIRSGTLMLRALPIEASPD